jgi:hypothetical protein
LRTTFNHGNKILTDPSEIANRFYDYFTNVGPNLARQIIPTVHTPLNSFLTDRISETVFINPTNMLLNYLTIP